MNLRRVKDVLPSFSDGSVLDGFILVLDDDRDLPVAGPIWRDANNWNGNTFTHPILSVSIDIDRNVYQKVKELNLGL